MVLLQINLQRQLLHPNLLYYLKNIIHNVLSIPSDSVYVSTFNTPKPLRTIKVKNTNKATQANIINNPNNYKPSNLAPNP